MSDFTLFLGKFFRHGTKIASLAPSSPWLSRTTVRNVDWDHARVLVELGAGTGPITKVLAEKAQPDCKVIVLERDHDFAEILRERFGGLAELRRHRGGLPRPRRHAGRPRHRAGRPRDLRPARALVPEGPPARPVPGRPPGSRPRGLVQPDHRDALGLPGALQDVLRRGPLRLRARNFPPAGAYFCRGIKPLD